MKLRYKKTGEIIHAIFEMCGDNVKIVDEIYPEKYGEYSRLEEVNRDWEDYEEEPKDIGYWYIDDLGRIQFSSKALDELSGQPNNWMIRKLVDNYFKIREEAEKELAIRKARVILKEGI